MKINASLRFLRLMFLTSVIGLVTGCGSNESPVTDTDPDLMDELLDADDSPDSEEEMTGGEYASNEQDFDAENGGSQKARRRTGSAKSKTRTVSRPVDRSRAAESAAKGHRLELRLRQGDRFPLIKTIEQTLVQKSNDAPAMAHTRLELVLAISVEQVQQDSILLGVRYSKVAYEHDVNGQRMVYDSSNHLGPVPWDAVPYAGMVGNGFSFWLGKNNRIREMVGYREFLERCVAQVPLDRRETLLSEISNRFGDDGVANFIDDSIGLLPYDDSVDADAASRVLPGDVWFREQTLMQPVPVNMKSTFRLTSIDEKSADIDITGRIAAGDAVGQDQRSRLRITGGHSLGRCVVDRATGLPTDMTMTRFINMTIVTPDQREIAQEKQIVTTIRAFPEMRGPVADVNSGSGIRRASAEQYDSAGNASGGVVPIPTRPAPGQPVQAKYPN